MKFPPIAILVAATVLAADADKTTERIESIRAEASRTRWEAVFKADREYRAALAKTFQFADRVEVYLLDFSIGEDTAYTPKEGDAVFPITPYNKETKILKTHQVAAKDTSKWCAAVRLLLASDKDGGMAMCHYPIHGIRIYSGDTLLFETSLCWACSNYSYVYEDKASWESITEDARGLKALLDESMPVPASERDRFHARTNLK